MGIEARTHYCVFYLNGEGELIVREDIGVDDLALILKEADELNTDLEVLAFNMKGIAQLSDIANHPEITYDLIVIKNGALQIYEAIDSDIEELIQGADQYYLIDEVYITTDDALRQLVKLGNILL